MCEPTRPVLPMMRLEVAMVKVSIVDDGWVDER
jgi:hypothetical protein